MSNVIGRSSSETDFPGIIIGTRSFVLIEKSSEIRQITRGILESPLAAVSNRYKADIKCVSRTRASERERRCGFSTSAKIDAGGGEGRRMEREAAGIEEKKRRSTVNVDGGRRGLETAMEDEEGQKVYRGMHVSDVEMKRSARDRRRMPAEVEMDRPRLRLVQNVRQAPRERFGGKKRLHLLTRSGSAIY